MPKYNDFELDIQVSEPKSTIVDDLQKVAKVTCLTSTPRQPCCMIN